jgi:hypothetical protein
MITKDDILIVFETPDGSEAIYNFRPCTVSESFSKYQEVLEKFIEKENYRKITTVELDETTWLTIYVKSKAEEESDEGQ